MACHDLVLVMISHRDTTGPLSNTKTPISASIERCVFLGLVALEVVNKRVMVKGERNGEVCGGEELAVQDQ